MNACGTPWNVTHGTKLAISKRGTPKALQPVRPVEIPVPQEAAKKDDDGDQIPQESAKDEAVPDDMIDEDFTLITGIEDDQPEFPTAARGEKRRAESPGDDERLERTMPSPRGEKRAFDVHDDGDVTPRLPPAAALAAAGASSSSASAPVPTPAPASPPRLYPPFNAGSVKRIRAVRAAETPEAAKTAFGDLSVRLLRARLEAEDASTLDPEELTEEQLLDITDLVSDEDGIDEKAFSPEQLAMMDKAGVDRELSQFAKHKVYTPALRSQIDWKKYKKLTCRWVKLLKRNAAEEIVMRCRFVCREFRWLDPFLSEVFAPTSSPLTCRVIDMIALMWNVWTYVLDVSNAFIHVA